ncbi:hypothetical protein GLOIN_2v1787148 [Rhizophagus clarus]|uniref:Uncharacterized protein n=1 Tax=Rhizophagus clarus TaxID=94130 RepID=A0A8H3LTT3_9GLOM|nr:hypothetical protein GLOIN_2v1787148 [Rhizophagus clarus]
MISSQKTCTYKTYDEFTQHFITLFYRSFASSRDINPHIILNKTGIAEWKKVTQRGCYAKNAALKSIIQQATEKKLNEELATLLSLHFTSTLATIRSWYPKKPESLILGLIKTTPKGKGKKKKKKQIIISYDDINKDFQFPDDSEVKFIQAPPSQPLPLPLHDMIKKVEKSSAPLLDSHTDILIYDIPAKWDNYELLSHLSTWGNVISISTKCQHKYKTNLAERKERERFQAVIYDLPEFINMASLTVPQHLAFFSELNIKMFKEIKFPDELPKRKNQGDHVDTKSSNKSSKSIPATGSNKTHIRNLRMKDSKTH